MRKKRKHSHPINMYPKIRTTVHMIESCTLEMIQSCSHPISAFRTFWTVRCELRFPFIFSCGLVLLSWKWGPIGAGWNIRKVFAACCWTRSCWTCCLLSPRPPTCDKLLFIFCQNSFNKALGIQGDADWHYPGLLRNQISQIISNNWTWNQICQGSFQSISHFDPNFSIIDRN